MRCVVVWPLLLCVAAPAVLGQGAAQEPEGIRLVRAIAALLPAFDQRVPPAVYDSTNLWNHINGDADRYLAYQFCWAASGVLERRDTHQRVTLDVYAFASPLDAFGAHSMNRSAAGVAQGVPLPGGTSPLAAYLAADQLHLWRGCFAVVISPVRRGPPQPELALEVGRAACRALPRHTGLPRLLRLCPPTGVLLATMRYQRGNVFGRAGLGNAVLAGYGTANPSGRPGLQAELAVFEAVSPAEPAALRDRLLAQIAEGGTTRPAPELGGAAVAAPSARFGESRMASAGNVVALVYHVLDEEVAARVLRGVLSRASAHRAVQAAKATPRGR